MSVWFKSTELFLILGITKLLLILPRDRKFGSYAGFLCLLRSLLLKDLEGSQLSPRAKISFCSFCRGHLSSRAKIVAESKPQGVANFKYFCDRIF